MPKEGSLRRHLIHIGGRHVHYRRAGSGPPIVLLPPTNSAKPVLRYVDAFADRFTVLLFDTPGYGLSDRLAWANPSVDDYADALAEALVALGLGACGVLGSHGGATFALALARRHPHLVKAIVIDEHPAYSADEVADMLQHYLPPFEPRWCGTHLVEFWWRYREQALFRPWHRPSLANRIPGNVADLDYVHDVCLIQFGASRYAEAYVASLTSDGVGAACALTVPAWFTHRRDDVFLRALRAPRGLPRNCAIDLIPLDQATHRYRDFFAGHLQGVAPLSSPPGFAPAAGVTRRFHRWQATDVLVRSAGVASSDAIVLVPRMPGGSTYLEPAMVALAERRYVVSLDLPGNGDSEAPVAPPTVDSYVEVLATVLAALGVRRADVYAHNAGAAVAIRFARRFPTVVDALALDSPPLLGAERRRAFLERYAEPIVLREDGGHLLSLWRALRNEQLFWPWYEERPSAARQSEPELDPNSITARAIDILKQHSSYAAVYRALLDVPIADELGTLPIDAIVGGAPSDVFFESAAAVAQAAPKITFRQREPGMSGQSAFIAAAFPGGTRRTA